MLDEAASQQPRRPWPERRSPPGREEGSAEAGLDPSGLRQGLALGAVAISTRVVGRPLESAGRAGINVGEGHRLDSARALIAASAEASPKFRPGTAGPLTLTEARARPDLVGAPPRPDGRRSHPLSELSPAHHRSTALATHTRAPVLSGSSMTALRPPSTRRSN